MATMTETLPAPIARTAAHTEFGLLAVAPGSLALLTAALIFRPAGVKEAEA